MSEPKWILLVGDPIAGFMAYDITGREDPMIEKRFANDTRWILRLHPILDYGEVARDALSQMLRQAGVVIPTLESGETDWPTFAGMLRRMGAETPSQAGFDTV